jgi:hypothetical protein
MTPAHYFWSHGNQTTDAQTKHVPARTYFYNKIIHENQFPFWTEKMYAGFPIYADPENAYLNPINDASILIFGPLLSYKMLHLFEYLLGSLSFYFLLKRWGIGFWGFAVANVIFYFNTFFINHQVHFNMIMALFLFPTILLLADLFLEKKQLRYILLESLVIANAVLWGHIQSVIIMLMGLFVYMVIFSFKNIRFKTFVFFFATLSAFVFFETLPQTLPTYELLSQSSREGGTDYTRGSLNPRMAIFSFIPYLFGEYDNFIGEEIKNGYGYGEIYTYFGISSVLLSFLALIFLKKSREAKLAFVFIWIFLIFGFMDSNKIFSNNTPIISLFRVWARTVILSGFGVAVLVGILIERLGKVSWKNIKGGLMLVVSPLIYIGILIKLDTGKSAQEINPYVSYQHIQAYSYFPVLRIIVLFALGVFLLFLIFKKWFPEKIPRVIVLTRALLVLLVFFDLIYFNQDVLKTRLNDTSSYEISTTPKELKNKRAVLNSQSIAGMESLYYDNWSPFGSSQLKEKDYINFCNKLGFKLRGVSFSNDLLPENYQKLGDIGIVAIARADGIDYLNNKELDLIKNNLTGKYLEKKEGYVVVKVNSSEDVLIETYLKYNSSWRVRVDGEEVKIFKKDIFLGFPLSKGEHVIEMHYCPKTFYIALAISLTALTIFGLFLYFYKRKIKHWMLS